MSISVSDPAEAMRLTDEQFWENLWASQKVPARVNTRGCLDRCFSRLFLKLVPEGRGKKLVEIGAAPGRWLVFFHEKLGYQVDGIEYTQSAFEKTEENLAVCGTPGRMFQQDFFHNDLPKHSYDAVLSLGFIEHFTDLDTVVEGHIALLKPGGLLLLGVPNFHGLHGAVERRTDPANYKSHNLNVMSVPFMEGLSAQYDLTPLWIGYIGGINPYLITVPDDGSGGLRRARVSLYRFVIRLSSFIRNRIIPLDYLNGPLVSSYLMAVYKRAPGPDSGQAGPDTETSQARQV